MKVRTYTTEELGEITQRLMNDLVVEHDIPALAVILSGALLAFIRAAKDAEAVGCPKTPSIVLKLEPILDEVLRQGVPVITTDMAERVSAVMRAGRN